MFITFSQLPKMSKEELWRLAADRKNANPIRRAAMREWMTQEKNADPNSEVGQRAHLHLLRDSNFLA
jgi:hypothetical protein